jgi:hypothetical protein
MSEYFSGKIDYASMIEEEHADLDPEQAQCLSDYLDHIMDIPNNGRTATCDEEKISQSFSMSGVVIDPKRENIPADMTMYVQHDIFANPNIDDIYNVRLVWRALRGDVENNSYARNYHLSICKTDESGSTLVVRHDPSADTDGVVSNYPQIDQLLKETFYDPQVSGTYEAEQLFDELVMLADLAEAQTPRY